MAKIYGVFFLLCCHDIFVATTLKTTFFCFLLYKQGPAVLNGQANFTAHPTLPSGRFNEDRGHNRVNMNCPARLAVEAGEAWNSLQAASFSSTDCCSICSGVPGHCIFSKQTSLMCFQDMAECRRAGRQTQSPVSHSI